MELRPNFSTKGTRHTIDTGFYLTEGEDVVRLKTPAFGTGRHWQLRVGGRSNDKTPEVHEVLIEYYPKDLK